MDQVVSDAVEFAARNAAWLFWIALVVALAETMAFLSFAVPSIAVLAGLGAVAASGKIELWPLWLGAALRAVLGASLSYAAGRHWSDRMLAAWPLSRDPQGIARAAGRFARREAARLFMGHFLGPLRGVGFLIAGMSRMPPARFHRWNAARAVAWAIAVPLAGQACGMAVLWIARLWPDAG